MLSLLRVLPVLVVFVAAVESILVRIDHGWRPTEPRLFLQTLVLWSALGLLALIPAALTRGLVSRFSRREPWAPTWLLGWMVLPVLMHVVLDKYTSGGGNLSRLLAVGPWLELAGVSLGLVAVLFVTTRLLRRVPGRPAALVVSLASIVGGLFLPLSGARTPRPEGGAAGAAAAGAEKPPNILLLVWDTCRSDRLQPYGYDRATSPYLRELAAESIVFEESISVAVFTFTSHLSLLTGLYPSTHGARLLSMRYDPRRATTLPSLLHEAGYRTGGFVGTDVLAGRTGIRFGFERYDDQVDPPVCDTRAWKLIHDVQTVSAIRFPSLRNNGQPHWIQDFQRPAEEVLENALEWIREDDPRPWFCFINLYDVHWPYLPDPEAAEELVRPYEGGLDGFLFRSDRWYDDYEITAADRRHVGDLYEAEIRELDETVAAFLETLNLGAGGTAVLVTADHGEAFGEAQQWKHEDVNEPQVRVPFLLRTPEAEPRGQRRSALVSGVDVTPTLLGLAGVEAPEGLEGVDLLSPEAPQASGDRLIFVEDRDHGMPNDVRIALYRWPFKLVKRGLWEQAKFVLHDLSKDPQGTRDVARENPQVFEELKAILEQRRAAFDEVEVGVTLESSDHLDALRALGYAGDEERH